MKNQNETGETNVIIADVMRVKLGKRVRGLLQDIPANWCLT
jgi:hypothetical protein